MTASNFNENTQTQKSSDVDATGIHTPKVIISGGSVTVGPAVTSPAAIAAGALPSTALPGVQVSPRGEQFVTDQTMCELLLRLITEVRLLRVALVGGADLDGFYQV